MISFSCLDKKTISLSRYKYTRLQLSEHFCMATPADNISYVGDLAEPGRTAAPDHDVGKLYIVDSRFQTQQHANQFLEIISDYLRHIKML